MITKRIFFIIAMLFAFVCRVSAEKTSIKNLYRYRLSNGLEVFIAEDDRVPTVFIQIAVKAGGIAQTPKTAGLFHLYEHMMFKSNSLYSSAKEMNNAMKKFGVSENNGTTSSDCVEYHFTLPANKIEEGLAFWNAAIRSPALDEEELEREKKVVLAEIEGNAAEQSSWLSEYVNTTLFPKMPYKRDSGGSFDAVRNATVEDLREMQKTYYIPSNAALFIAGDVKADEVMPLVRDIFGSWENGKAQVQEKLESMSKNPLKEPTIAVFPTDSVSDNLTRINVYFRAPDADFDLDDSYVEDYLAYLLRKKDGIYKKSIKSDKRLDLFDDDSVGIGYSFGRISGLFHYDIALKEPSKSIIDDALYFKDEVINDILPKIAENSANFSDSKIQDFIDDVDEEYGFSYLAEKSTIDNLLYFWTVDSADYFLHYEDDAESYISQHKMKKYIDMYFTHLNPLIVITMSNANFKELEESIRAKNVTVIEDDSYVWWKNPKYAEEKKIVTTTDGIYVPNGRLSAENKKISLGDIEELSLKNGIKVYVQKSDRESQKSLAVTFVLRGGIHHIAKGEEGLESMLFHLMDFSSKKYKHDKRESLEEDLDFSIDYYDNTMYSDLQLVISNADDNFEKPLDVFVDGILHPIFDEKEIDDVKRSVEYKYTNMMSVPDYQLRFKVQESIFADYDYAINSGVVSKDLDFITKDSLKALYDKVMNSGDMFIVATGNVDKEKLIKKLDKTLGKLKQSEKKGYFLPPLEIKGAEPCVEVSSNANGFAFAQCVHECSVDKLSKEYVALLVASNIYSTELFNIVREKHGACYGIQSYIDEQVISEWCYKVSDVENFVSYINEARENMKNAQTIEELLDGAKIALEIDMYSDWKYVSGKADSIVIGKAKYDNVHHMEEFIQRIREVTADEVKSVFQKYWIDSPSRWFAVTGEEEKDKIAF